METNIRIGSFDDLKLFVEGFLSTENRQETVFIGNFLRRPMREFKELYPNLVYFAYGLGQEYKLALSKDKFKIDYYSLSAKTKKVFVEYSGLRIDPNADLNLINKLNPYLELDVWFDLLSDCLLYVGGEKEFMSKHFDVEKKIWTDLTKSNQYAQWKTKVIHQSKLVHKENPVINNTNPSYKNNKMNNGIYSSDNNGCYLLSIDLKAANFQVLRSNGLINVPTWPEYLSKFIDSPYFAKIKKLRLKALSFPGLIPAKQKVCWQNIILSMLDALLENSIIAPEKFAVFNSDEIVFHTSKESMIKDKIKFTEFLAKMFPEYTVVIDIFQLRMVSPNKPYYVKINQETGKLDWKCLNAEMLPEAVDLWLENN